MGRGWEIVALTLLDLVSGFLLFHFYPQYTISGTAFATGVFLLIGAGAAKPVLMFGISLIVSGALLTLYIASTGFVLQ